MFDIYGNMKEPPVSEPLKVQKKGGEYDRRKKFKPQRVGMQVPCCVDTEMPTEAVVEVMQKV